MVFIFLPLSLLSLLMEKSLVQSAASSKFPFVGEEYWDKSHLKLCESTGKLDESLFCYTRIFHYERLNVEVLSEDPILIIYKHFAPKKFVDDFLTDARKKSLRVQRVIDVHGGTMNEILRKIRVANGTQAAHEESSGFAKLYRRVKALIPSVDFRRSAGWQVVSYNPGGHYAPHFDYINYKSPKDYESRMREYGNRFATLHLMLQPPTSGGGTTFPLLNITVMPSIGDAVFWTKMNIYQGLITPFLMHHQGATFARAHSNHGLLARVNNEDVCSVWAGVSYNDAPWLGKNDANWMNGKSLHGGCPVWEGEKVIATLWIRSYDQELLETITSKGHMDIAKLIDPNLVHH